jgi:hypothetical protein
MNSVVPAYPKPLSLGGVIGDAANIFRQRWSTFVGIMVAAIVPFFILFVIGLLLGLFAVLSAGQQDPNQLIRSPGALTSIALGSILLGLLFALFQLAAQAAAIVVTGRALLSQPSSIGEAFRAGLPRIASMLGAAILIAVLLVLLAVVSIPLLVLCTLGLFTLIALAVWAANPGARRPWLKWFIILTVPFGLPIYFGTRWALYGPAIVLEHVGPSASLRRSAELTAGRWWWVFAILVAIGIITSILQAIPGAIVGAIVAIALRTSESGTSADAAGQIVNSAVSLIGWVLFGAFAYVGTTVLFASLHSQPAAEPGADQT